MIICATNIVAFQVPCDRIVAKPFTCRMGRTTKIHRPGAVISTIDGRVTRIEFETNKDIHYLPIEVYQKYPNLIIYEAHFCAIKEIEKRNFEKLYKLKTLTLQGNQIEAILNNTFDDLVELERLSIGKSRLKLVI